MPTGVWEDTQPSFSPETNDSVQHEREIQHPNYSSSDGTSY